MQGVLDIFKKLGPGRLAAMGAVAAVLLGFFGFVILRFSQTDMAPLFTGLDERDSAAIVKALDSSGVAYTLRGDGTTILVPADKVARLRMTLAADGLPSGGGIGYEIFDKGDSLSATSFVQNINQLRALEGELSRTIRGIDRVEQARVHLVIPEKALFQRDREPPSASIVLKVRGGLEPSQIRAIRHLVATAVEGLKPDRVSIVDESGALLADGASTDQPDGGADERQMAYERRVSEQVQRIVESVVGPGRAKVQVTAELDFNRITQTQDSYDPDSKVVRSTQTREESASNASREQTVTVGNELPNAGAGGGGNAGRDVSKKTEETVNYEISRTTKTETTDGGRIKRMSVAVLVDGLYAKDGSGALTYAPRAKEDLDRIGALVRSAIGFDQQRGDQVEVVNLRFAEAPTAPDLGPEGGWMSYFAFTKDDIMRLAEMGVLAILSILVLLLAVRPLIRRVVSPETPATELEALTQREGTLAGINLALAPPGGKAPTLADGGEAGPGASARTESSPTLQRLELAQINGSIQQKSVERVGELVQTNPAETLSVIRTWLAEPA